jgi:hypothetical protein
MGSIVSIEERNSRPKTLHSGLCIRRTMVGVPRASSLQIRIQKENVMRKIILAVVATAAIVSAGSMSIDRADATTLGAATASARLDSEAAPPVTEVRWWWHRRHHPFFRAFAFHRFHRFHHRCWRCW